MKMFALLVAVASSSCCQTIWFKVMRRESSPVTAIVLPETKPGTIPIPKLENRFLGAQVATTYTDQIDPRNDSAEEMSAALEGREAIWRALGDGTAGADKTDWKVGPFEGTVKCRPERRQPMCLTVLVPALTTLPFIPKVARITYTDDGGTARTEWHAVRGCEGITDDPSVSPAGWRTETNPCGSTYHGTRLTMTRSIGRLTGQTVQIELDDDYPLSRTALTFVHLSDTQLRDNAVKLTDPVASAQLDRLVESFEHDDDQELYGAELAEAMVATINQEVAARAGTPEAPSFMIHTGDSIDASTLRELRLFHEIMDRLVIPWFNVLGNHDVLVFGNFLPAVDKDRERCVTQQSIAAPYVALPRWLVPRKLCVPEKIEGHVGPDDTFIAGATHAASRDRFVAEHGRHFRAKVVTNRSMTACPGVLKPGANDQQHGFDLSDPDHRPGYYAFALELDLDEHARRGIFIVLNSEDLDPNEGGNAGRLQQPQLDWLAKAFACAGERDLIFLFAHHSVGSIKLPDKTRLRAHKLMQDRRIAGFFYGHAHVHGLCRAKGACTRFWELESGSLIEHPQEGRLIRIKTIGGGVGFIETVVFTERLADETSAFARRVALARAGADRDHCLRNRCSSDNRVRRKDGAFTNARLFFKLP